MKQDADRCVRRYAIRATGKNGVRWYTDDGGGGDESRDMTPWSSRRLVVFPDREHAQYQADRMAEYAKARGLRLKVTPVWDISDGFRKNRPKGDNHG